MPGEDSRDNISVPVSCRWFIRRTNRVKAFGRLPRLYPFILHKIHVSYQSGKMWIEKYVKTLAISIFIKKLRFATFILLQMIIDPAWHCTKPDVH